MGENTEKSSALDIESLEVFENIAYIMAKHADAAIPASPDEWLEQFNTFSIYEILPQLIDLWGLNVETQVKSKKNIARLTPDDNSAFSPEMQTTRSFYDRAGFADDWTYQ